ncbi:MAG TPA: hypothetical protein PK202_10305 [Verrucomicrobiota bacterium]|nr:hypothetical protein [Verrucomicrobiota bacterium]HOX62963.1 hypothetical protein [Verrucomicrobiota bacterium]HPI65689.1 hypothetical protein [Verrucomicrobiota bacterium]HPO42560.1 hypothetical protein [Verrucomicrobiota bacterium]HPO42570.1 hypothetical protein [Verrucomicrobiota bacterium]
MSNQELIQEARKCLYDGVRLDPKRLEEAARYLHQYLFATSQAVDFASQEQMEVFELYQVVHHLRKVAALPKQVEVRRPTGS